MEDTFSRVQARLQHLCDEANDNLYCAVEAECIGNGFMEQFGEFADGHDALKMVIIDTFQTVRTPSSQTIYSADYEDMGRSTLSHTSSGIGKRRKPPISSAANARIDAVGEMQGLRQLRRTPVPHRTQKFGCEVW